MSIEKETKTSWDIHLEVCTAISKAEAVPKTKWVPREEYDSVLNQLIRYQKALENKVEEYASDRYDLCSKIQGQAKEIRKLKASLCENQTERTNP
jgi:peptidoglycan hydrolase CwlO-like protein